jgi:hypothetical protein
MPWPAAARQRTVASRLWLPSAQHASAHLRQASRFLIPGQARTTVITPVTASYEIPLPVARFRVNQRGAGRQRSQSQSAQSLPGL